MTEHDGSGEIVEAKVVNEAPNPCSVEGCGQQAVCVGPVQGVRRQICYEHSWALPECNGLKWRQPEAPDT